ncbi:MAG: hypothetical protein U0641_20345 [Anaerolineae bacterium]
MSWKRDSQNANREWVGPIERYDLIQEGIIAVVVVAVLVVALSVLFGSPMVRGVSFQSWANADPKDFVNTTLTELAGTSETATYGPPYNNQTGQLQSLGPISPQAWVGVRMLVNPPDDFVVKPLAAAAALNPDIQKALGQWAGATPTQQQAWSTAALSSTLTINGSTVQLAGGKDSGPIPTLLGGMLKLAQTGGLTSQSIDAPGNTYSMNYTKSLLYIEDGDYLGAIAEKYNLTGKQWGVMGEIGNWPGQPWLWFYTMWYNVPLWSNIGTDILAVATVVPVVLFFLLIPFIPGVRSLPRGLRVYRRIWRSYYQKYGKSTK